MNFLRHFHKPAFLSQFLLGIVAIFALPATQPLANESDVLPAKQLVLRLSDFSSVQKVELEAAHLLHLEQQPLIIPIKQAVVFCEFFAKSYRLYQVSNPPIRAGPTA
ncbi:secA translation cis-regulator SecM [Glaesserella sp.]|uniref:secA translation cis-regulator SecM n=1 Tax=Glaesserella sp. TaxID=2094731 RepID=UPI0035A047DE